MKVLSVDLGTTLIKCGLFDERGSSDFVSYEYPLFAKGEIAEQEAEDWYETACRGIRTLAERHGIADIGALCVSSQSITFVPMDAKGIPLSPAITWLDNRAAEETEEIRKSFSDERIFDLTGKRNAPAYTLPKLLWLKRHRPEIWAKTERILFPPDYLNFRLTGKVVTDYTIASGSMAFDIEALTWSEEILSAFGIPKKLFPEVAPMGTEIGTLLPEAAAELGLAEGVRVLLGGQDQKLAALGAGIDDGIATVSLGTATAVSTLRQCEGASVFAFDGRRKIYEGVLNTSGAAIAWLRRALNFSDYAEMDAAAEAAGESGGVRFEPDFTKGARIESLHLGVGRGQIVCALYEGIARAIGALLPAEEAQEIVLFGGGAKSAPLCRTIQGVCKGRISRSETSETALLGAAILAFEGKIGSARRKTVLC